jgi:hypothetical protein
VAQALPLLSYRRSQLSALKFSKAFRLSETTRIPGNDQMLLPVHIAKLGNSVLLTVSRWLSAGSFFKIYVALT